MEKTTGMPNFSIPTHIVRNWLSPALTVLLIGFLLSSATAVVLRQDDLERMRTDFELRSTSVIAFIQFDSSRSYAADVSRTLNEMAEIIANIGIDAAFPLLEEFSTGTRNIAWIPNYESSPPALSSARRPQDRTAHPLLDDFAVTGEAVLEPSVLSMAIERLHTADQDGVYIAGIELASHDIVRQLLIYSRQFNSTALFSAYSLPSAEFNLPYMNLRLHLKPVFANDNPNSEFMGYIGIIVLADMASDLLSGFTPPGGIALAGLENHESIELRNFISQLRPLTGGSRADRGSGPTDIVTFPRPEFLEAAASSRPIYTFSGGLMLSLLMAGYVRLSRLRTEQVARVVNKRTMELSRSNNQLQLEILQREKAQKTLAESEENYRLLAEHITDIIWKCDLHLHPIYVSPSSLNVLGYTQEELVTIALKNLFSPHSLEKLISRTQEDKQWSFTSGLPVPEHLLELEMIHKSGHTVSCEIHFRMYVDDDKQPVGYVGVTRDISQRREQESEKAMLEAQLFQARKMEAIGSLAGGVAHDFNNLLTGIMGYSTLLESRSDVGPDVKKASAVITSAAERGRRLTQNLLGFARKGKFENKALNFSAVVSEVTTLLKQTTDPSIQINWDTESEPCFVFGDPDQLHLVVMNLVVNAKDSFSDGGTVNLSTRIAEPAENRGANKQQQLVFSVSDNGPGIPEEIKHRIFEPFYTTKEQGQGTGLGLATVYGIVEHHGGSIHVDSELGKGSVFSVRLPLVDPELSPAEESVHDLQSGSGNILVVDDDDDVRDAVVFILQSLGYKTSLARNGQEALATYRDNYSEIDIVLLDWRMPGMNGKECFLKLRSINPEVVAILTTGFGQEGMAQELLEDGIQGFIRKPYRTHELADVIASAMRKHNTLKSNNS